MALTRDDSFTPAASTGTWPTPGPVEVVVPVDGGATGAVGFHEGPTVTTVATGEPPVVRHPVPEVRTVHAYPTAATPETAQPEPEPEPEPAVSGLGPEAKVVEAPATPARPRGRTRATRATRAARSQ